MKCFIQANGRILSPDQTLKELTEPETKTIDPKNQTKALDWLSDERLEQLAKECIKKMKETLGFDEFLKSIGNAIPHFEAHDNNHQNQRIRLALEKALHNYRNETLAEHNLELYEFSEINSQTHIKTNTSELERKCTYMIYFPDEYFRRCNIEMVRFNGEIHLKHSLGSLKILGDEPCDIVILSSPDYLKDFLLSWIFLQTNVFDDDLEDISLEDDDDISDQKNMMGTAVDKIKTSFSPSQIAILILSFIAITTIPTLSFVYQISQISSLILLTTAALILTLMWRNANYHINIYQSEQCPIKASNVCGNSQKNGEITYEMVRQDVLDILHVDPESKCQVEI